MTFTALPVGTEVPADGVCEMTMPTGTVAEGCVVTAPPTRLAPLIAMFAAASVSPTTFGTSTGAGPVDTTISTALPLATVTPPSGFCEITLPAGTLGDDCDVTVPTIRPAALIALVAAAWVSPTTLGTVADAPDVETCRYTVAPPVTMALASGDCAMTPVAEGTGTRLMGPATSPAALIADSAAASERPTRLGIDTP